MPWELWVKILHFALSKDRYFLCFYINFTPSVVLLSLTWTVIVLWSSKHHWSKNFIAVQIHQKNSGICSTRITWFARWTWCCDLTSNSDELMTLIDLYFDFETNVLFLNADILALWRNNWPVCTWGHSLSPTSPKSMCTSLHRRQPRMEEGHLASTVQTCCLGLVTISTQFCQLLHSRIACKCKEFFFGANADVPSTP